jgi:hypothetical protein
VKKFVVSRSHIGRTFYLTTVFSESATSQPKTEPILPFNADTGFQVESERCFS